MYIQASGKKGRATRKQRKKTVLSDSSSAVSSVSDGVEYSSEEATDSDLMDKTPHRKNTHRRKRIRQSRTSGSSSSESENVGEVRNLSDSDLGESSKSILEQVNQRSRTMSARKSQEASKFDEIRRLRDQKQKKK